MSANLPGQMESLGQIYYDIAVSRGALSGIGLFWWQH